MSESPPRVLLRHLFEYFTSVLVQSVAKWFQLEEGKKSFRSLVAAFVWRREITAAKRERERRAGEKSENKYWKKPLFRIDIQHQACTVISVCWGYSEAAINPDKSEFKRGKETESYGWWIIRVMGARKTFLAYIAFMQPVSLVSTRPPRTVPTVLSQRRGNMVDINGKQNIF